jgi:hypothetical protein
MVLTPELQLALAGLVGFLVTAGIKDFALFLGAALSKLFKKEISLDFSSLASVLTGTLVTLVVVSANSALALVPANLQPIVLAAMPVLVAILSAFGIHGTIKSLRPNQ